MQVNSIQSRPMSFLSRSTILSGLKQFLSFPRICSTTEWDATKKHIKVFPDDKPYKILITAR